MHRVAASCLLLLAFSVHEAAAGPAPADPASGIEAAGLMADIATLSDPATRGRLPGDPAFDRVVDAMAERFAGLGLRPGGDEGFRQNFAIESNIIPGPCRLALAGPDGAMQDLTLGDDYIWRGFTGGGEIEAPVVFAGYGLASSDRGYDDYDDIDVAGKIVLAFKQAPRWRPGDGEGWGDAASPRPKALAAAVRGARGLLLVSRPGDDHPQPVIGSVMHGPGVQPMDVPQAQISLEQAARLFAGGLDELRGLQVEIDEARAPRSRELEARARMEVRPRYDPRAATANVVGILPGSDPDLAGQCVVMGAHLDHVGKQGDVVFPGANDNASGSAAVVAAAAALARAPESPRRSIVFVLFAGEEQGLLGAEHYAAQPAIPLESTVAMTHTVQSVLLHPHRGIATGTGRDLQS